MIDAKILMQAVLDSRDGVTISDANLPDNPLIFVNHAFEKMTGYSREEAINRNCRYLQGAQKNQRNIEVVRDAIKNAEYCLVTLKNYRKDGSMFWNELSISPVFDLDGKVTHFIGIQKDVTARVELETRLTKERKSLQESKAKLENLVIHDSLTGIYNRRHFETQFKESWQHLVETQGSLTLMMVDVDYFKRYNDTYGHVAGDDVLKKVASALTASMKRVTDFTARYGGEEFIIVATDITRQQAINYGKTICANLRSLNIPHETSSYGFLTVSCGVAHINPLSTSSPGLLLQQADTALYNAKANGRNQAVIFKNDQ
jgi:diguanylate cyclase (GGDEF)-like protein/PAS domain S-box-containing protein